MPHKGASTQCHNQQVLAKPRHQPSDRDQQAREKLQQKAKIKSQAYIQLGEEALQIVHRTFQPDTPVIFHLPALADSSLDSNLNLPVVCKQFIPSCIMYNMGGEFKFACNHYWYRFNIGEKVIYNSYAPSSTSKQTNITRISNLRSISQQTHPSQPGKTRVYPFMLTNKQVPVLNLTETSISRPTAKYVRRRKNLRDDKRIYTGYTGSVIAY